MNPTIIAAVVVWVVTVAGAVTLGVYGHPWLAVAVLISVPTLRATRKQSS